MTNNKVRRIANEFRAVVASSPTSYAVGDKVTTREGFTSPIGIHYPAGTVFTVEIGGQTAGRSIALRCDGPCASRAWISDGLFLAAERAS